jgi:hypothetical protein
VRGAQAHLGAQQRDAVDLDVDALAKRTRGLVVASEHDLVAPDQRCSGAEPQAHERLVIAAADEHGRLQVEVQARSLGHLHVRDRPRREAGRSGLDQRRRHRRQVEGGPRPDPDVEREVVAAQRSGAAADEAHAVDGGPQGERRLGAQRDGDVAPSPALHLDQRPRLHRPASKPRDRSDPALLIHPTGGSATQEPEAIKRLARTAGGP